MPINVMKIMDGQSITAGGNAQSDAIDITLHKGFYSLQVAVSGDGTVKGEALLSNNDDDYLEPDGAADVFSDHTKTSGPGSDGKAFYQLRAPIAKSLKIKITETGGADSVTVSAWLAYQN